MNKILEDGDKLFLNSSINNIEVNGMATILVNNIDSDIDLTIDIKDNAILNMYDFNLSNKKCNIVINQHNNSKCNYVHTFKVSGEYKMDYLVNIKGDNIINNVYISGVSNGMVSLNVDGNMEKNFKNNELNENIKILTVDGSSFVSPMLHVSELDVIANHNTAISNIRKDELFYLNSKGIDDEAAKVLIEDGYIYGYIKRFNEEFYNLIKE